MTATLTRTDPTPPPATPRAARRDRLAFAGLLVATAALYLVNLSANGWGNDFYAAAVQSMTKSWEANLVRNRASSRAESPPPTTTTVLPLKKKPSQVAQ